MSAVLAELTVVSFRLSRPEFLSEQEVSGAMSAIKAKNCEASIMRFLCNKNLHIKKFRL
jgi:hypothetical protein